MSNKLRKEHKINGEIRATELRLAEEGIMSLTDALSLAESKEMDLVMINESAVPPICKIMNYEKFLYEKSKKPKNKSLPIKEIKLSTYIADNDIDYKTKHAIEFLTKGHKVKLSLQFRGREMAHIKIGQEIMLKFILAVESCGGAEALPTMEGKKMYCILKPKNNK